MSAIPFAAIKAAAPHYTLDFCLRYLSAGKRVGNWWLAPVPWRTDRNPSLGVSLTTGCWQDYAHKEDHGDLPDLFARVENCDIGEAGRRLAVMMRL